MPEVIDLLKKASISMLLDGYDDIFSDFDPRPYTERAISDDFLIQAHKAVHETKSGHFELHLLIPKHKHNPHEDPVIKERLHQHFRISEHQLSASARQTRKKGILLTVVGFILMFLATYARISMSEGIISSLILVFLEPGGWFMVWYGLDIIFYISREKNADLEFNRKMVRAEIHFNPY